MALHCKSWRGLRRRDGADRPLRLGWHLCRRTRADTAISSYSPRSFDSRYLGPVPINSIRGTVKPLWTLP